MMENDPKTNEHQPRRMLICDDNPVNRKIACMMANRMGFEVVEADNGLDGQEILATQQFDILLLDISMPGMSGDELLAAYHAFPGERARLLEAGFDDLLVKPVSVSTFEAACL